jgi:hypothetical protein
MAGLPALGLYLQEAQGFLATGIGSTPRSGPLLLGRCSRRAGLRCTRTGSPRAARRPHQASAFHAGSGLSSAQACAPDGHVGVGPVRGPGESHAVVLCFVSCYPRIPHTTCCPTTSYTFPYASVNRSVVHSPRGHKRGVVSKSAFSENSLFETTLFFFVLGGALERVISAAGHHTGAGGSSLARSAGAPRRDGPCTFSQYQ